MCFGITYGYNAYYWDNSIASALGAMALFWYLFGVWIVCLVMLFSSVLRGYSGVLLGTAGAVIVSYVAGLIPKLKYIVPTALINTNALIAGAEKWEKFIPAVALNLALCVASSVLGLISFRQREL